MVMFSLAFSSQALSVVQVLSRGIGWDMLVHTPNLLSGGLKAVSLFTLHKDRECSAFIERRAIRSVHFSNVCK